DQGLEETHEAADLGTVLDVAAAEDAAAEPGRAAAGRPQDELWLRRQRSAGGAGVRVAHLPLQAGEGLAVGAAVDADGSSSERQPNSGSFEGARGLPGGDHHAGAGSGRAEYVDDQGGAGVVLEEPAAAADR